MAAAGVRPQERRLVLLVAGVFAALEAGRGIGEVGADTLVVGRLGADALPVLYIPLGLLSLVAALAYGAALGRFRRGPLFAGDPGAASSSSWSWSESPSAPDLPSPSRSRG